MELKDSIYPDEARLNVFYDTYCEIAMESFYDALIAFEYLETHGFKDDLIEYVTELEKNVIKTVVFSAMSIESFFNNYAAATLGDEIFYDNFDKLSTISKFQLISRFILKTEINKGEAYYSYIKKLFKYRDEFIHNKSVQLDLKKIYEESVFEEVENSDINEIPSMTKGEIEGIKNDLTLGLDSLKAIREIALYFDKNDTNIIALQKFFTPTLMLCGNEKAILHRKKIFPLLNIYKTIEHYGNTIKLY